MNKFKSSLAGLLTVGIITLAAAVFAPPAPAADYQGFPSSLGALTNVPSAASANYPTTLTNGAAGFVAPSNNIVAVHSKSGLSFTAAIAGTAANQAGNLALYYYVTTDGTNYWTAPWASQTIALAGTNIVIAGTNWTELQLRGILDVEVGVSNAAAASILIAGTVTNGSTTFVPTTNSLGVITNQAFINNLGISWNRPNL